MKTRASRYGNHTLAAVILQGEGCGQGGTQQWMPDFFWTVLPYLETCPPVAGRETSTGWVSGIWDANPTVRTAGWVS